jgi:soluble lytic murein transglycosylase-like protein
MTKGQLNRLIQHQEPFKGSLEEFLDLVDQSPAQAHQLVNFVTFTAQKWDKLTTGQKQQMTQILEEFDQGEPFHQALGVNSEETFTFNGTEWEHNSLEFFNINLDLETSEQLKAVQEPMEMTLKLNPKKILCFEMPFSIPKVIKEVATQKTVQLALGLALLSFSAFSLQTGSLSNFYQKTFYSATQATELKALNEILPEAVATLASSPNPQAQQLVKTLQTFNFKPYADAISLDNNDKFFAKYHEADEALVEQVILHFYEETNPQNIEAIKPHLPKLAKAIVTQSAQHKVDFRILLGIIKVESDFKQDMVSSTGDYSMAQINYDTWSKELKRTRKIKLDKEKLKKDINYSISMMTEILKVLHSRHQQDPMWYARYHSSTPSLKLQYATKVNAAMGSIKVEEFNFNQERLKDLISQLKAVTPTVAIGFNIDYEKVAKLTRELETVQANFVHPATEIAQN